MYDDVADKMGLMRALIEHQMIADYREAIEAEFDVPVRFDTDKLPVQANAWDQQIVPQINLIEVLE